MPTTITIDRDLRDGLYELVRNHLGSVGDLWVALEHTKDFDKAEQLALEFAEDFQLLRDLGWEWEEERAAFELNIPGDDLMTLLGRLHGEAMALLTESGSEAESSREDEETTRRLQRGYQACEIVLAELDSRREER